MTVLNRISNYFSEMWETFRIGYIDSPEKIMRGKIKDSDKNILFGGSRNSYIQQRFTDVLSEEELAERRAKAQKIKIPNPVN